VHKRRHDSRVFEDIIVLLFNFQGVSEINCHISSHLAKEQTLKRLAVNFRIMRRRFTTIHCVLFTANHLIRAAVCRAQHYAALFAVSPAV